MRNMSRIFVSSLVIIFTTGQTSAQAGIAYGNLDTIISWGSNIIPTRDAPADGTNEEVGMLLAKVNEISTKLGKVETQISDQLDILLNISLNYNAIATSVRNPKRLLLDYLSEVNHDFDDSLKYKPGTSYNNKTLEKFAERVLYGKKSITEILDEIYYIFDSNVRVSLDPRRLQIVNNRTSGNLLDDCHQQTSPYQLMYYIHVHLMMTEMKGLGTVRNIYQLKGWLENSQFDYKTELEQARIEFEKRVRGFHEIFVKQLAQLPRHVSRCHVDAPKQGVDFLELKRLSQARLIKLDSRKQSQCNCCLQPDASYTEKGVEMKVHNCKALGQFVEACPAENGLPNDYSWWSDDSGTYGKKSCSAPKILNAGVYTGQATAPYVAPPMTPCHNWYCTVEQQIKRRDDNYSWRISSKPQIADVWNNMIVTGLQFIVKDRTIHLQIQQGKFSDNGLVYNDIAWKDVNTHNNVSWAFHPIHFDGRIAANQKTIYLDDITVPNYSVVTGVQLLRDRNEDHFRLYVHATVFDFATGQLSPSRSFWCTRHVCGDRISIEDNVRDRSEIDLAGADNPLRGSVFNYDPESNKMVEFTHTDAHKDAGQTTIPFIDLQPVQVQPAFPLSGVGLYYRGKKGFGGYIAPRVHTFDVAKLMMAPRNNAH